MSDGWICLHRSIQDHWLWKDEPYDKARAWIDLLLLANHEERKTAYKGEIIVCKRGTVNRSVSSLAARWNWDRRTVKKFLELLENDGMCITECTTHRTTITIVNYSIYQDMGAAKCTTKRTTKSQQDVQQSPTNNKDNNVNKETNIIGSSPAFISLPLNDGSEFVVTEADVKNYKELYPAVNVEQELRKMKGWCEGNPKKLKTKSGIKRFINSWLAKEQDRPRKVEPERKKQNSFAEINKPNFDVSELEKMLGV